MKHLLRTLAFILLAKFSFAQGYNVTVCGTLSGPPGTGAYVLSLNWFANGNQYTTYDTLTGTLPLNFCFNPYLQLPDTGNTAFAYGVVAIAGCGPTSSFTYSSLISADTTINVFIQNCGGLLCSSPLNQIPGTTIISCSPTGNPPFQYSWDGGITYSSNSSINTTGPGVYCVNVIDASGCTSSDCITVNTTPNCQASISVTGAGPYVLTAASTGVPPITYLWSNGSTSSTITASTTGNYCLTAVDANGCADTSCVYLTIGSGSCTVSILPYTDPITGQISLTAVPDSNSVFGATYVWSNGQTGSSIIPSSTGNYCVTATYSNGCTATSCYFFTGGGPTGGCSVYTTAVEDSSTAGLVYFDSYPTGVSPFTYSWLFSDGTTSSLANPVHMFTNAGGVNWAYLTVTDANGCVSNYSINVYLANNGGSNCSAYYSAFANYQFGVAGEVFFQDLSLAAGTLSYSWSFGDGSSSTAANPSHIYSAAGNYNICLTITSSTGCTNTFCQNMYIDPAWWLSNPFGGNCTAGFLVLPTVPGTSLVNVINTSQGNNLFYTWNFGNGIITNTPNPFVTFSNPGTYNICLTITDSVTACTDTFCDTIMIDSLGNVYRSMSGNVGLFVSMSPQPNSLLGINDQNNANSAFSVLPNPSNGQVSVKFNSVEANTANIQVTDVTGKIARELRINVNKGDQNVQLNLNDLQDGMYFVKLLSGNQSFTTRLIIKN